MTLQLSVRPRVLFISLAATVAATLHAVELAVDLPAQAVPPVARGHTAPASWPANAFLPLTADRINALPAVEQPAWRAYWAESERRIAQLKGRDLADHSATKPIAGAPIGASYSRGVRLNAPAAYFASPEARAVADHVVNWQTAMGAWTKSGDYTRDRVPADDHHDVWSAGTFDNDSTITELRFLARVAAAAEGDPRVNAWRTAFERGLAYVLAAQYPNGGFPQIYPLVGGYHDAITFNDDAMVHILEFLRDVSQRRPEYAFVSGGEATQAGRALERGIACVLAAQLRTPAGQLTLWGQQHDPLTLQPCAARNFEPISGCTSESTGLVQFLMTLPQPTPAVRSAIDSAVRWLHATAIRDTAWDRKADQGTGLVARPGAPWLWARFYELGTSRPIFGERDRTVHYAVTELSAERRLGYGWYNTRAAGLDADYAAWQARTKR
ncbi:pectate lyase [Opitutus sp. ER46]|uniref:pectate lyase n=1 Tax=Opitutus sp. ER46 TaxID=2161864 RepID=UPI000D3284CE|nr:pectate lyase [Opitutus sp. ER46]PTX94268.1 pectate lyase [Opitutus sp. ER46]